MDKEDVRKYLEFLQNIISRMANNSFKIKGWTITLTTAVLGILATQKLLTVKYISILLVPIIGFSMLDAYYLKQERIFRKKYDKFVNDYNSNSFDNLTIFQLSKQDPEKIKTNYVSNFFSKSIIGTYLTLVVLIIITIFIIA